MTTEVARVFSPEMLAYFGLPPNASIQEIERRAYITNSPLYALVERMDVYKLNPAQEELFVTKSSAEAAIDKHKQAFETIAQSYLDLIELYGLPKEVATSVVKPPAAPRLVPEDATKYTKELNLPPLKKETLSVQTKELPPIHDIKPTNNI